VIDPVLPLFDVLAVLEPELDQDVVDCPPNWVSLFSDEVLVSAAELSDDMTVQPPLNIVELGSQLAKTLLVVPSTEWELSDALVDSLPLPPGFEYVDPEEDSFEDVAVLTWLLVMSMSNPVSPNSKLLRNDDTSIEADRAALTRATGGS